MEVWNTLPTLCRKLITIAALTFLIFSIAAPLHAPKANAEIAPKTDADVVPGQILVKYKRPAAMESSAFSAQSISPVIQHLIFPDGTDTNDKIAQLQRDPNVEYAEPVYKVHTNETLGTNVVTQSVYYDGNHMDYMQNWGEMVTDLTYARDNTPEALASQVLVAVVDSGVDLTHPDLVHSLVLPGYNAFNPSAAPQDDNGHGTNVAGIIAAKAHDGTGYTGVAPGVKIMPIKVLDNQGAGTTATLVAGIQYAIDHNANMINMSLGDSVGSKAVHDVIKQAVSKNILVVAAAGNDSDHWINSETGQLDDSQKDTVRYAQYTSYPAAYDEVISVGAVEQLSDTSLTEADFSNVLKVDVAAPGVNIYSAKLGGGYGVMHGTSQATPFVTGLAALLKANNPQLNVDQLTALIENSANQLTAPPLHYSQNIRTWNDSLSNFDYYGHGLINGKRAFQTNHLRMVSDLSQFPVNGTVSFEVYSENIGGQLQTNANGSVNLNLYTCDEDSDYRTVCYLSDSRPVTLSGGIGGVLQYSLFSPPTTDSYHFKVYFTDGTTPQIASNSIDIVNRPGAPLPNLSSGTYTGTQSVSLTSSTDGAVLYYAIDDGSSSARQVQQYSAPITISKTSNLITYAIRNHVVSDTATYSYAINTPTGSVVGGGGSFAEFHFQDQDPVRGAIHPLIYWSLSDESRYASYDILFVDTAGTTYRTYNVKKHASPGTPYQLDIAENELPPQAVYVYVRPKDADAQYTQEQFGMQIYDNTMGSPASTISNGTVLVPNLKYSVFNDSDLARGTVGGAIDWFEAEPYPEATSYALYFVDANHTKLQPIAEIKRSSFITNYLGITLPSYEIQLPNGTPLPQGTRGIGVFGKNDTGEMPNGYFIPLWDAIDRDTTLNYMEDTDNRAGSMNQEIQWVPQVDETNVRNYQVQLLDDNNQPIGDVVATIDKGQPQYKVTIPASKIPQGAKLVRVTAANDGASADDTGNRLIVAWYAISDNILGESTASLPADNTLTGSLPVTFIDYDGDANEIGGYFSFYQLNTGYVNRYDVYFVNDQLQKLKPIISMPSNQFGNYWTSIPMNTKVPEGATNLAVYPVSAAGEGTPTTVSLGDKVYSPALQPSQVQIVNNQEGTADSVAVSGLLAGDVVKIYRDSASANSLQIKTVAADATSVAFQLAQLGRDAGSLYVTLQRGINLPSPKLQVNYAAEPTSSPPAPILGGGGGGGGGGGSTQYPPALDADGKMTYDLTPASIDLLISLASDAKDLTLDAKTTEKLDKLKVEFDAGIIQKAADRSKSIVIASNDVTLTVPPNAFQVSKDKNNTLVFQAMFEPAPAISNFNAASAIYDFSLTDKGGAITTFDTPLQADFAYDASKVHDPRSLGVYVLDEQSGAWTRVGGTVNGNGTITASLPHFSKYAVLEKASADQGQQPEAAPATFADIQGHWAQKEIEQLAGQHIIDGMDDVSFQPDANMSRAQFVTVLTKALKLQTKSGAASFEDVAGDAWYKDAVYAAYEAKIVSGVSERDFAPAANITREQMAVMMVNAYMYATGKKLSDIVTTQEVKYTDEGSISDWARAYVRIASGLGLLNGSEGGNFAPADDTSRAQAAVVIYRLLNKLNP